MNVPLSALFAVLAVLSAERSASAQSSTLYSSTQGTVVPGLPSGGPYVPPGNLYDNEQSNASTSLASADSAGTFTARTADDFQITAACASGEFEITQIRVHMVQSDTAPQPFAVDLYADDGTGTAPTVGISPIATFPESSQLSFGTFGTGTSVFEVSLATPGLVLNGNTTYWISGFGADAAANAGGFNNFFAASAGAAGTTANGVIIAPDAGVAAWTPVQNVIGGAPLAFSFAIDGSCRILDADLSVTKTDNATTAVPGTPVTYTMVASNVGPGDAIASTLTDTFPASLGACAWSCVPSPGAACTAAGTGNIADTLDLPAGTSATYTATCNIAASATGTLDNTVTVAVSGVVVDPDPSNNSATDSDTLSAEADLSITLTDTPDPVTAGNGLSYLATLSNAGPSDAQNAAISLLLPVGVSLVSSTPSAGGNCTAANPVVCTWAGATVPTGSHSVTIATTVSPAQLAGLSATATAYSDSADPVPGNNDATASTTVVSSADLQLSFSASTPQASTNEPVSFAASSLNAGPSDAQNVSVSISLTPDFRYSALSTGPGASCTTPQVGTTGTIVCTWVGATAPAAVRNMEVIAYSNSAGATAVNASNGSDTPDPVAGNDVANVSVQVGFAVEGIPALGNDGLILLALALALLGAVSVRRDR
ncbi:MAG: DUF11 domain-containing protein [Xanthomonadales bacterium]|nr:DUF11 domain-containing protein [Xanthomonadales bacterium]